MTNQAQLELRRLLNSGAGRYTNKFVMLTELGKLDPEYNQDQEGPIADLIASFRNIANFQSQDTSEAPLVRDIASNNFATAFSLVKPTIEIGLKYISQELIEQYSADDPQFSACEEVRSFLAFRKSFDSWVEKYFSGQNRKEEITRGKPR